MRKVALALVVVTAAVTAASAVAGSNSLDPRALTQARKIKADITARYVRPGGPKLVVTEASPTGVIESFLLLSADFLRATSRVRRQRRPLRDLPRPRDLPLPWFPPGPTG